MYNSNNETAGRKPLAEEEVVLKCETCGHKLVMGHKEGNHVRGENDQKCDFCINK